MKIERKQRSKLSTQMTESNIKDSKGDSESRCSAPDAMNQSIFQMIMAEQSPHRLSQRISSLYSPETALHKPVLTPTSTSTTNASIALISRYMPYPLPWRATAGPDELPPDFGWVTDSCSVKAAIGVFGGAACGLLMGVFLGAMSDMTPPVTVINGKEVPQAPLKEQMRTTLRATAEKSIYWSRNFAFITGVFGGSDCLVEKYRGTHDVWNSVISGCVTGAAMQAKQGPQAAAIGCGGFAAFSLVIDKVMGH